MQTVAELDLNEARISAAKDIYRAINHSLRRKMLERIHAKKKSTVTELYRELNLEQSVASLHLAILRKAKIVKTTRDRRNIFYSVNYERIGQIHEISRSLISEKPVK